MTAPEDTNTPAKQQDRYAHLNPRQRAHMEEIRARNGMVQAIAGESWGNKLTPLQQRAFAEYIRRFRLDISEVNNLGGRPYRNGNYYMRRVAELASEGKVEWYKGEHIGPDDRLDFMAKNGDQWAIDEQTRRLRECIRLGVPATATHVYLVTIKMVALQLPTEGVKWYEPGKQKMGWSKEVRGKREMVDADPVGDENPELSVETRAWRRAGRIAAAEIPELRAQEELMELAADETQQSVLEEAMRAEALDAKATVGEHPIDNGGDNPYGDPPQKTAPAAITPGPAQPVPVPTRGTDRVSVTPEPEGEPDYEFTDGDATP